jgi:hypothetical protein
MHVGAEIKAARGSCRRRTGSPGKAQADDLGVCVEGGLDLWLEGD